MNEVDRTLMAIERRFRDPTAKTETFDVRLRKLKGFLEDGILQRRFMTVHEATILDVIREWETGNDTKNP